MRNNNQHIRKTTVNVCRLILAVTFIVSGFVKLIDPIGFQYKIQEYVTGFGLWFSVPDYMALLSGMILSVIEFSVGFTLLFGIRKVLSSLLAFILLCCFTLLTCYIALFSPVVDCGCFGEAWKLTNWQTLAKNVVLLLMAFVVVRNRAYVSRLLSARIEDLVWLYTVLFAFVLSLYCYNKLPILDFRPYKRGTDLSVLVYPAAMGLGDETVFVMEKEGERREFTTGNYPDSTWTFISAYLKSGNDLSGAFISDLLISDINTGEDITEDILLGEGYTFLLISPHLEEASDNHIDLINEAYDYAVANSYQFLCLTASMEDGIGHWQDYTGAEYPFYHADETVLKTIVRSNPGLVLVKDGVIVNKWSDRDIPDEHELNGKLERIALGTVKKPSPIRTIGYVLVWYIVPLLLIIGLEILLKRIMNKRAVKRTNKNV